MRVAHIVKQFWPSIGGIEDATLNLVLRQRSHQEIEAEVITLDRTFAEPTVRLLPDEKFRDIPIQRVPWCGSIRYPLAPSVLNRLKSFDLIHVHGIEFFFDYLAFTKKIHRKPMVASTHGGFFHTKFAARAKQLYFQTITRASVSAYSAVVGSSKADSKIFERIHPKNLVTIENGVDINKFANAAAVQHTKTMIYFGRFASHKKISSVILLFAELRKLDPAWKLIIAGSRGDQDVNELSDFARMSQVEDAIVFSNSPDEKQLRALLGQSTYFVCASEHEGFGLAAIEAMSAGLIPLLSSIPTFTDFVERAGVGMIFHPDSPREAAGRIHAAQAFDNQNHHQLRERAIKSTLGYGWEAAADRYKVVYEKVIGDARPRSISNPR